MGKNVSYIQELDIVVGRYFDNVTYCLVVWVVTKKWRLQRIYTLSPLLNRSTSPHYRDTNLLSWIPSISKHPRLKSLFNLLSHFRIFFIPMIISTLQTLLCKHLRRPPKTCTEHYLSGYIIRGIDDPTSRLGVLPDKGNFDLQRRITTNIQKSENFNCLSLLCRRDRKFDWQKSAFAWYEITCSNIGVVSIATQICNVED